jgi:hypothetical protein
MAGTEAMTKDLALLSDLDELNDTPTKAYLEDLFSGAVTTMIQANDVHSVYRAQGEARVLQRLIQDIETAADEKIRLREQEGRLSPRHMF